MKKSRIEALILLLTTTLLPIIYIHESGYRNKRLPKLDVEMEASIPILFRIGGATLSGKQEMSSGRRRWVNCHRHFNVAMGLALEGTNTGSIYWNWFQYFDHQLPAALMWHWFALLEMNTVHVIPRWQRCFGQQYNGYIKYRGGAYALNQMYGYSKYGVGYNAFDPYNNGRNAAVGRMHCKQYRMANTGGFWLFL
jgi:hypothetical protein